MIIRAPQFEAFEREMSCEFVHRLAGAILDDDSDEWVLLPRRSDWVQVSDLPLATLIDMISAGVTRAARYGFDQADDVLGFISLMFSFAPNFDEQPAIHRILDSAGVNDRDRLMLVSEMTSEQEWDEVEDDYNEWAWLGNNDLK